MTQPAPTSETDHWIGIPGDAVLPIHQIVMDAQRQRRVIEGIQIFTVDDRYHLFRTTIPDNLAPWPSWDSFSHSVCKEHVTYAQTDRQPQSHVIRIRPDCDRSGRVSLTMQARRLAVPSAGRDTRSFWTQQSATIRTDTTWRTRFTSNRCRSTVPADHAGRTVDACWRRWCQNGLNFAIELSESGFWRNTHSASRHTRPRPPDGEDREDFARP